ncbi:MAG: ribosome maturation factor RimP [Gammaproteobacteria bacterium]
MRAGPTKLETLLEPTIVGLGYELVGIEQLTQSGQTVLRIYIDGAAGIQLADCERVSRQVGAVLDVEDPIRGPFTLEVSSPGLDRPLFRPEHFDRFAGAQVRISLAQPWQGRRRLRGRLCGRAGAEIIIDEDGTELHVPYAAIERARLSDDPPAPAGAARGGRGRRAGQK